MNVLTLAGLAFLLVFGALILFFARMERGRSIRYLRDIPGFSRIRRGIGLAVEAGQRLHLALGHGGVSGFTGASSLVGLSLLERTARTASISDRPPVATSGKASLTFLSQDTLKSVHRVLNAERQYDPQAGQLTGLTPFSYAAGTLLVSSDPQVSANIFAGHFGSEVALILDAAERNDSLTLGGSDDMQAQAVMYASSLEPLVGEELYAAGAYLQVNPYHLASVRAQDVMRWVLAGVIVAGALLKALGLV